MRYFTLLLIAAAIATHATATACAETPADQLAAQIEARVHRSLEAASAPLEPPASVAEFATLAIEASWTEVWPDAEGKEAAKPVRDRLWNAAIQAALAKHGSVFLPNRGRPYYINDPIVLKSGQRFVADRGAEIRLVPGMNTCMLRNEHIVSGQEGPVPEDLRPDTQIAIEGGIWTTLATSPTQCNGNDFGRSAKRAEAPGCHGVILMNNVRGLQIRHVVVRQAKAHAMQLSNCREFLVEGVRFEDHRRDGVHVNGPASYGIIRDIRGVTGDDFIALNAWDWRNAAPTFGPIHHILVENIHGDPQHGGTDEIRLLPGTKTYANHLRQDCPIEHCVLRDLHDLRTFKMYDQPNLELGRDQDFCDPIGTMHDLHFCHLVFHRPGRFQIAANADGLAIDGLQLAFDPSAPDHAGFKLVEIGPMSETYKIDPNRAATWVELFSPDRDVTVRNFRLTHVTSKRGDRMVSLPQAESQLVKVSDQKPNPEYPKTTPRGGTGKGKLVK